MPERITEAELIYSLEKQDPSAYVLIVEGDDDLRFLSLLVPFSQRSNAVVYPIRRIEVGGDGHGGDRGRILQLAAATWGGPLRDRILYLIDADNDRLCGLSYTPNVIFTDYRDFEAYAYSQDSIEALLYSMREGPESAAQTIAALDSVLRPCGYIRIMDAFDGLNLPFQRTWCGRLGRYIDGPRANPRVDTRRLLQPLLQNSSRSLAELDQLSARTDEIASQHTGVHSPDLVHGKDFIGFVAWRFRVTYDEATRAILACIACCLARVRSLPAMARVDAFVRQ